MLIHLGACKLQAERSYVACQSLNSFHGLAFMRSLKRFIIIAKNTCYIAQLILQMPGLDSVQDIYGGTNTLQLHFRAI